MTVVDALRKSDLFGALDTGHVRKVADLCRGVSSREGTVIFEEGDEAVELYILTEGWVVLDMEVRPVSDRPAVPTAVELVGQGEFFGWSAVVEPYVYTLSARCMTSCTALAIKGDMLRKTMNDDPGLGYEVMKKLAQLIGLRLAHTRLRLTTGLGLVLHDKELDLPQVRFPRPGSRTPRRV